MTTEQSELEPVPSQTGDKGEPDSPLDISASGWKETLKRTFAEFKADRGSMIAAGMAFYWFLAIFPALLAAVGFTGLVNASEETVGSITGAIRSTLPGDAARVLTDSLDQAVNRSGGSSVIAALIGVVLALYSASAGMAALQVGLNVAYDVPEDRSFLKKRLRGLLLMLVAVVLGGVATAAIVFGAPIGEALRDNLPFGDAFVLVWTLIRWVVGLAALATLFALFYYLGPNRETPRWSWLSPGGIVATVIWLIASLGFSFYVTNLGSYGETYGSLTGVVVLLLWLYLSALAIVLGGELNSELERQAEHQRNGHGSAPPAGRLRPQAAAAAPAGQPQPQPQRNGYEESWLETMRRVREGGARDD
ncbi:MAG: YihY/virulence factor BrkB family protein [Acidimicrobiia bacterium]